MSKFASPTVVRDVDVAFPARVEHLMPPQNEIPDDFSRDSNQFVKLANKWFYMGLPNGFPLKEKSGIDRDAALRHIACVIGSFEPSHEHKTAAVAYLMSLWFEPKEVP